ncbi:hypothetical protein JCM24511_10033 [Saitozyma sp. JCM 24511]|nr:hypothetical protein JCM24511_10033 [Saitozyma sp. JCM 24511]
MEISVAPRLSLDDVEYCGDRQAKDEESKLLCASRLTPLRKPDGGLRPIASGDMIYGLATKAIIRHSNRHDFLLPYQFGVGSKGGVDPLVRPVERDIDFTLARLYTHVTSLDFSSAFNTVRRGDIAEGLRQYAPVLYRADRWAYGSTSSLVLARWENTLPPRHRLSVRGIRWDCSFSPSAAQRLASAIGQDGLVLAYLDDIYILGPDDLSLDQTQAFFEERLPSIRLNPAKHKLLALEDTGPMASRCLELAARERFLHEKIDHEASTVGKLINLPLQHRLLSLRRSLKPDDLVHHWDKLDPILWDAVARPPSSPPSWAGPGSSR